MEATVAVVDRAAVPKPAAPSSSTASPAAPAPPIHMSPLRVAAVGAYVGTIFLVAASIVVAALLLPHPAAVAWLALLISSLLLPLSDPGPLATAFTRYAMAAAADYFPVSLVLEDGAALTAGRQYVIAYEPHSALPVALPVAFCELSPLCPPALRPVRTLASSACFRVPLVRHLWWWLGGRHASGASARALLASGHSVAVCPGGVRECAFLKQGEETVFVRERTGFIRLALQAGAPVVPVFAFGQTSAYSFALPGPPLLPASLVQRVARVLGCMPLLMWGVGGTPLPHRGAITVVVGRPIGGGAKIDNPSPDLVSATLATYVAELEGLYARHAEKGVPLTVL